MAKNEVKYRIREKSIAGRCFACDKGKIISGKFWYICTRCQGTGLISDTEVYYEIYCLYCKTWHNLEDLTTIYNSLSDSLFVYCPFDNEVAQYIGVLNELGKENFK